MNLIVGSLDRFLTLEEKQLLRDKCTFSLKKRKYTQDDYDEDASSCYSDKKTRVVVSGVQVDVENCLEKPTQHRMSYINERLNNPFIIKLVRIKNQQGKVFVYAHGASIGTVIIRKSNISRLLAHFKSPSEKVLLRTINFSDYSSGQECNVLTQDGIRAFISLKLMQKHYHYAEWLENSVIPKMDELQRQ
jgi:hypothetical protein